MKPITLVPPYRVVLLDPGNVAIASEPLQVWPFDGTEDAPDDLVSALRFTSLLLQNGAGRVLVQDAMGEAVVLMP